MTPKSTGHQPEVAESPGLAQAQKLSANSSVESLTLIWQRVLRVPAIGINDNFFDLGGDSSLALQLFTEIAETLHRELPPVTIYQAPTIAALSQLLEEPVPPRFPSLVLLKTGSAGPPVFVAHGLGGSVMDFFQPVRHIQTDRSIYGMQARGIDGVDPPLESIEDMASFHIAAMKGMQPQGPYALVGYSLGGLVALEMAQQLIAQKEKISLLLMLDAYPHMRYLSLAQRTRLIGRQARRGLRNLGDVSGSASYKPPAGVILTPAMQHVRDKAYLALTRYRPRYYPGKIGFVRAEISTGFPSDPAAVWGNLVKEIEVETVTGDHLGMMAEHYEELASVISRRLAEAV